MGLLGVGVPKNPHEYNKVCHLRRKVRVKNIEELSKEVERIKERCIIKVHDIEVEAIFPKGTYLIKCVRYYEKPAILWTGGVEDF
ncbi:hypothetical protein P9654_04675 [Bacillus atrophaeus]|uniref:hypothetical protein n=1 Tax=Bacillus atrophaeus TaxID=1452 RepID=UPI002E2303E2|nr:hypothetical protein [Bacillus atrophaeus]